VGKGDTDSSSDVHQSILNSITDTPTQFTLQKVNEDFLREVLSRAVNTIGAYILAQRDSSQFDTFCGLFLPTRLRDNGPYADQVPVGLAERPGATRLQIWLASLNLTPGVGVENPAWLELPCQAAARDVLNDITR